MLVSVLFLVIGLFFLSLQRLSELREERKKGDVGKWKEKRMPSFQGRERSNPRSRLQKQLDIIHHGKTQETSKTERADKDSVEDAR